MKQTLKKLKESVVTTAVTNAQLLPHTDRVSQHQAAVCVSRTVPHVPAPPSQCNKYMLWLVLLPFPTSVSSTRHKDSSLLVVVSHSVVSDSATPWTAACQDFLSFTISWSLLQLVSIESDMPSNHLILSSPSHPAFNRSSLRVYSNVNSSHQVAEVLEGLYMVPFLLLKLY